MDNIIELLQWPASGLLAERACQRRQCRFKNVLPPKVINPTPSKTKLLGSGTESEALVSFVVEPIVIRLNWFSPSGISNCKVAEKATGFLREADPSACLLNIEALKRLLSNPKVPPTSNVTPDENSC